MTPSDREPVFTTDDFYASYYGVGQKPMDVEAFLQIRDDSDRAAGIVAGAMVEARLVEAIRSRMRSDRRDITKGLFEPEGALGAFGAKIDLAYLLDLLSDDAFNDLNDIKKVRNKFAHRHDVLSFEASGIRELCARLRLVVRHTGPLGHAKTGPVPSFGYSNHSELISQPRFRYVTTSQILCNRLGQAALSTDAELPFV